MKEKDAERSQRAKAGWAKRGAMSPEMRAALSAGARRWWTPERRARQAEAMRAIALARWQRQLGLPVGTSREECQRWAAYFKVDRLAQKVFREQQRAIGDILAGISKLAKEKDAANLTAMRRGLK